MAFGFSYYLIQFLVNSDYEVRNCEVSTKGRQRPVMMSQAGNAIQHNSLRGFELLESDPEQFASEIFKYSTILGKVSWQQLSQNHVHNKAQGKTISKLL